MEFRFRAGDARDSVSSSSSNGAAAATATATTSYFTEQALRAGISIGGSGFAPPGMSSTDALLEELRKERIRNELLLRERRLMEEEMRRGFELDRRFPMRSFEGDRFSPLPMEAGGLGSLSRFHDVGVEERVAPQPRRFSDVWKTEVSKTGSKPEISTPKDVSND